MLGRLHMDIDTCISKYEQLSSIVFRPKRMRVNFLGKGKDAVTAAGVYSGDSLAEEIKKIVNSEKGNPEAKLREQEPSCKVYVHAKSSSFPRYLRSQLIQDPFKVSCAHLQRP